MMFQSTARNLKVSVLHSDPVLSLGLYTALRESAGMDVELPTCGDGSWHADVIIADYKQGLEYAADEPTRTAAGLVVVTTSSREQEIRRALDAGIQGYVLLGCDMNEVTEAVRVVGQGSKYLCLQAAQRLAESLTRQSLTARELDVLRLLVGGFCNKNIARDLDIALCTAKVHVKAIMAKLGASSRTHAVSLAVQRGLVSEDQRASTPWATKLQRRESHVPPTRRAPQLAGGVKSSGLTSL